MAQLLLQSGWLRHAKWWLESLSPQIRLRVGLFLLGVVALVALAWAIIRTRAFSQSEPGSFLDWIGLAMIPMLGVIFLIVIYLFARVVQQALNDHRSSSR